MGRKYFTGGALGLAVVAGLLLGQAAARAVLPAWLGSGPGRNPGPMALVPCTQRDLGTVPQGEVLQAAFAVTNTGTRRLILLEQSRACCGRSTGRPETAVLPGETTELRVQVDTSRWCGQVREVVRYHTNDPGLPRLCLTVTARVVSSPQALEEAEPADDQPADAPPTPDTRRTAPRPALISR